jgi:CO/xanthine dehydrogenase Mo-binding subunit
MNLAVKLAGMPADAARGLPGSLHVNRRLDQWLNVHAQGFVEIRSGKVELGQGIATALAQIAAEELDVGLDQIRMVPALTGASPDEAVTSGSLSVSESGTALRYACAEARAILLEAAARELAVDIASLSVRRGVIEGAGRRTTYWQLRCDELLAREAMASIAPKAPDAYAIVGTAAPRSDLPDKAFGKARFIHDIELAGMLHGAVLRPPSPAATLARLDETRARAVEGALDVVRDGSFVGVIARTERGARAARAALGETATWHEEATLPDEDALGRWLKAQPTERVVVAAKGEADARRVARTLRATYTRRFVAHASLAPSCAIARFDGQRLSVWSHTQGIYNLRTDLAKAFRLPPGDVVVAHVEGAGCYGHNGADDVAFDASRLARAAPGAPVRVQWSRADELVWSPFGPAMAIDVEADLDANGALVEWRHTVWSNGHTNRPGRAAAPTLLGAWQLAEPFERPPAVNPPLAAGGGAERNAIPNYAFPAWTIVGHRVTTSPLRTSALRALGAYANVFAAESFVDEIASAAGVDPLEFRLRWLDDPRARAVLERAAERARWREWVRREGAGHGIAFARYKNAGAYCAVVAEVEAGREIELKRLAIAVDVGLVINPDGLANQIEGGAVQSASWTLIEAVRFDRMRVTSDAWERYPILRFTQVPEIDVEIVSRPDCPAVGAGEAPMGPTAAAIGNAVFDALGVRIRDLPITAERIAGS